MRHILLVAACLLGSATSLAAAFPSLGRTLALAQERAYRSSDVDWPKVSRDAASVASTEGEGAAIALVLRTLGDGHSFYRPPRRLPGAEGAGADPPGPAAAPPSTPQRALSETRPRVDGVSVLQVNAWAGGMAEARIPAAQLRARVVDALAFPGCGLIVDFSTNSGGNMWPMLVGLAPLLTDGIVGQFRDAAGTTTPIEKRRDGIHVADRPHVLNAGIDQQPTHPATRLAIVVGPRSASSGEIVPILFHGQGNVRFFGQMTAGFATANSTYPLPNGGVLGLTTAVTLDRHGRMFDGHVEPDVLTPTPLAAAADWINAGCGAR